jgi:hypothetical protein
MDSRDVEHQLDQLRFLQHVADTARRWQAKRDQIIQMFYLQGTASLSKLAGAAGISKQRAHQIVRGPCVNFRRPFDDPSNRVRIPPKSVKETGRKTTQLRMESVKETGRKRARRRERAQAEIEAGSPSQEQIDKMNALLADIARRRT